MVKNTVHLIDNMEFMRGLPDNAYDLAIVDPPYGIGAGMMKMNNNNHAHKQWDSLPPTQQYFCEIQRVSVNQIIWGGNYFNLPPCKCFVIWDKKQPEGVSFSMAEFAWTSFGSSSKVFYQFPSHVTQGRKIHPTQKPVALYKWLLQKYAKPGQTIFDSHVGSGSIRIACHDLGFSFEGCEIDEDYWNAQEARYKTHASQEQLFNPAELTEETYKQEELI